MRCCSGRSNVLSLRLLIQRRVARHTSYASFNGACCSMPSTSISAPSGSRGIRRWNSVLFPSFLMLNLLAELLVVLRSDNLHLVVESHSHSQPLLPAHHQCHRHQDAGQHIPIGLLLDEPSHSSAVEVRLLAKLKLQSFVGQIIHNSHYVCSEKAVNWIYNSVEGRS